MEAGEEKTRNICRTLVEKQNDLNYGLKRERPVADLLEKVFNKLLFKSVGNYCCFDFYDKEKEFIFEIKNYRYSINKYNFEIIGINKLISNNLILIFRHEDNDNEIYFIQHNYTLFETFKKRYIGITLCVDIPKELLIKLDINEKYFLLNNEEEQNKIKKLLNKDKRALQKQNLCKKLK